MATPNNTVPHRGRVFQNWKTPTFSFLSFILKASRVGPVDRVRFHSCSQSIHEFGQSNRNYSVPTPNWKDDLSWPLRCVSHGECTSVFNAHWIGPMVNHNSRLSIVIIYQAIILHGLSTLRGYWVYTAFNKRLWPMGETLKWSYIPMDWVISDEGWWQ